VRGETVCLILDRGAGTLSTRTSRLPRHVKAFMFVLAGTTTP
jgi:hypothetical protein